jgi:hypothetical protein
MHMPLVLAVPELIDDAAHNLAGLGATLDEASRTAAPPTTGIVAAAQDEVSAAIARIFGAFGEEYQALNAQAAAFHHEFVTLLSGGANAYLGADLGNAEQALLGHPLSTYAPSLLASAPSGLASVTGPYEALFEHTTANLRLIGQSVAANPAPLLRQFLANQQGYAQTIAANALAFVQNFPASVQTAIQNFEQALANFDPGALLQTFVNHQLGYLNTIATAFGSAAHDFATGLRALPAAFQSAFQALLAGNVGGAVSDLAGGFLDLFVTGVDVNNVLTTFFITPTGTLGDLLPLLSIPGEMGHNLAEALPPGSIAQKMAQNYTNLVNTVTDTTISSTVVITTKLFPPSVTLSVDNFFGMPVSLLVDALGAPVTTLDALGTSVSAFTGAVQAGDVLGGIDALIDAPAVVADGFLNGSVTVPLTFNVSGIPLTINLPFNGILAPAATYTASVSLGPPFPTITVPVTGTPISGIVPALVNWAPEQLAMAIGT